MLAGLFLGATMQSVNKLAGTNWSLVKVSKGTDTQFADTTCHTTLIFDQKGRYSGYSGWNTFSGKYSITSKGKLAMNNPIRTKRAGRPGCMLGETLYDYFPKVNSFSLWADTLMISTTDHIKMVYVKK